MRILYHLPLSPFCRKVRLHLMEKNLEFTTMLENPWDRELPFLAPNAAAEVPVLIEDDGMVISGNYAIIEYLEERYGGPGFLGQSCGERAEVRRLVDWFDNKFDWEVTQKLLFEKIFKAIWHGTSPDSDAIRQGKHNILYHLSMIGHLASERGWLASERLTLADFAAASHLSALDYLGDVPWEHNAAAKEWYALIKSRPAFRPLLADRIAGYHPPAHYENLDF